MGTRVEDTAALPRSGAHSASPSANTSEFLDALFRSIEDAGLPYAIMRNFEGLPQVKPGNDIDVMVMPADRLRHRQLLCMAARMSGWTLVYAVSRVHLDVFKVASLRPATGQWPTIVHLDYFPGDAWHYAPIMAAEEALARRVAYGSIHALSPIDSVLTAILHHLLWSGAVGKAAYLERASELSRTDFDEMEARLTSIAGPRLASRMMDAIRKGDSVSLVAMHRRLRVVLGLKSVLRSPGGTTGRCLELLLQELRQVLHPPGAFIGMWLGERGRTSGLVEEILSWACQLDRYNHCFPDRHLDNIITSPHPFYERAVRDAYCLGDGALEVSRALSTIRRFRRRGKLVLWNCTGVGIAAPAVRSLDGCVFLHDGHNSPAQAALAACLASRGKSVLHLDGSQGEGHAVAAALCALLRQHGLQAGYISREETC